MVSVLTFMATAAMTATVISSNQLSSPISLPIDTFGNKSIALLLLSATIVAIFRNYNTSVSSKEAMDEDTVNDYRKLLPAALSGSLFAAGLIVSQMIDTQRIRGFVNLVGIVDGTYDAGLAFVMMGGLAVSFGSYQFVQGFNVIKVCILEREKETASCIVSTHTCPSLSLSLVEQAHLGLSSGFASRQ